jgi:hypothetical protein
MKIKIMAHVHYQKFEWEEKGQYRIASFKMDDTEDRTYVGQQEVEFDAPENYDPTAQKIAALQALKQKAQDDFAKSIYQINEKISKLQALEYTQ